MLRLPDLIQVVGVRVGDEPKPGQIRAAAELRRALAPELAAAQGCMPEHILFLDASDETLRTRKEGDTARTRGFFEHYRNQLLPLKREWFRNREDTTFLQTDGLTAEQEGEAVLRWCTQWIGMNR